VIWRWKFSGGAFEDEFPHGVHQFDLPGMIRRTNMGNNYSHIHQSSQIHCHWRSDGDSKPLFWSGFKK
jgi:hypothetical protein